MIAGTAKVNGFSKWRCLLMLKALVAFKTYQLM